MIGNRTGSEGNSCSNITAISLFLFPFLISYQPSIKAMLSKQQKKSLNTIGQVILNQYPQDKNSMFVAPPELFIFARSKRDLVEFIQNNQQPIQPNNTQTLSKKLSVHDNNRIK